MSKTPVEQLIPRADKHIIRAFPRVAQRLENSVDEMDRSEMDTFLKVLPGAIERFQAVVTPRNDLHASVEVAISQLVASFKPSFGPQNAATVEAPAHVDTSNMSSEPVETVDGDSGSELPNGSDTSQAPGDNSLPHNELGAAPSNNGELGSAQEHPQNARVRTVSKLQGRRAGGRPRRATSANVDD